MYVASRNVWRPFEWIKKKCIFFKKNVWSPFEWKSPHITQHRETWKLVQIFFRKINNLRNIFRKKIRTSLKNYFSKKIRTSLKNYFSKKNLDEFKNKYFSKYFSFFLIFVRVQDFVEIFCSIDNLKTDGLLIPARMTPPTPHKLAWLYPLHITVQHYTPLYLCRAPLEGFSFLRRSIFLWKKTTFCWYK